MTDPVYTRLYSPKNRILEKQVTVLRKVSMRETQHGVTSDTKYLVECPHGMLSKLYSKRSRATQADGHPLDAVARTAGGMMEKIIKRRLIRVSKIIDAIPFSASGTATSTGYGAIMFEEDMRAIRPYLRKLLEGMVLDGEKNLEKGIDYEDPDKLLNYLESWIEWRKQSNWEDGNRYSLEHYIKKIKFTYTEAE